MLSACTATVRRSGQNRNLRGHSDLGRSRAERVLPAGSNDEGALLMAGQAQALGAPVEPPRQMPPEARLMLLRLGFCSGGRRDLAQWVLGVRFGARQTGRGPRGRRWSRLRKWPTRRQWPRQRCARPLGDRGRGNGHSANDGSRRSAASVARRRNAMPGARPEGARRVSGKGEVATAPNMGGPMSRTSSARPRRRA